MYQVFLVDDEALIVEGLKKVIDWEKYGCTVCGTATDGKSGLAEIRRLKPDISVVSFDNSHLCELATPPLTSLSHGSENVGHTAAKKLLALLNGEKVSSELIPWTLIERTSG